MKKILRATTKYDPMTFDISTKAKRAKAYLSLFEFNQDFGCYEDLTEAYLKETRMEVEALRAFIQGQESVKKKLQEKASKKAKELYDRVARDANYPITKQLESAEKELKRLSYMVPLYQRAKQGEVRAIEELVASRKDYEYERVEEVILD